MNKILKRVGDVLLKLPKIDLDSHASSIAFFSFLSLVPLLTLCISLVSVLGISEEEVILFFTSMVPEALSGLIASLVKDAFAQSGLAFSISTLSLVWTASKGMRVLRKSLNAVYDTEETRGAVRVMISSIVATVALGLMLAAMMYHVFSGVAKQFLENLIPSLHFVDVSTMLGVVDTVGFCIIVLTACYAYIPAGKRKLKTQLPGAVIASLSFFVLSLGFRLYVEHMSDSASIYGSLATVALFLYWLYLMSYIIIAGGLINRLLEK